MKRPKKNNIRLVETGRLAYYRKAADESFWEQHWAEHLKPETYQYAEKGELGFFSEPFLKYLPRNGKIIEAGCGLGHNVLALRTLGFDCEGVEWAHETVKAVLDIMPDLPVKRGDVVELDVGDGYFDAYISLGVVEHRREGPEPFLEEAFRVLSDDGIMLLSVPYYHALRRFKSKLGLFKGEIDDLEFYQYAFSLKEMKKIMEKMKFEIVDTFGYDGFKGIKDEIPLLLKIFEIKYIGWRLRLWLKRWKLGNRFFPHMMLFICKKRP